jgi:hypothetical protein
MEATMLLQINCTEIVYVRFFAQNYIYRLLFAIRLESPVSKRIVYRPYAYRVLCNVLCVQTIILPHAATVMS